MQTNGPREGAPTQAVGDVSGGRRFDRDDMKSSWLELIDESVAHAVQAGNEEE